MEVKNYKWKLKIKSYWKSRHPPAKGFSYVVVSHEVDYFSMNVTQVDILLIVFKRPHTISGKSVSNVEELIRKC